MTRSTVLGLDLERDWIYYWVVSPHRPWRSATLLWRFHRSPVGSVLVAIRENEERARFIGYPTNRYKLIAFVLSAIVVAVAGTLSVFNHRFASAEPLSVAFSGELIAMVVIGGMRSFLGPALGALFFILFREFLSIWTPHWLFWFGLLFVGFIVFSPTGLVGVAGRLIAPFRARGDRGGGHGGAHALSKRAPLPPFYRRSGVKRRRRCWSPADLVKRFGGIHAVEGVDAHGRGPHAARADRSERRRQDHGLQPAVRPLSARQRDDRAAKAARSPGSSPSASPQPGSAARSRSPICSAALRSRRTCGSRYRRATASDSRRGRSTAALAEVDAETAELDRLPRRSTGIEGAEAASLSYGGQRLLDMGLALATRPRILLLDEPLAGLAAAERQRIAALIKTISADIPVLFVEHDIDRVFQIADHVTVMNEGKVLVDGTVEDARSDAKVREVYIGSGAAALAAKPRASRGRGDTRCSSSTRSTPSTARATSSTRSRSTCASTRSWRCSAATAPASRRCSRL